MKLVHEREIEFKDGEDGSLTVFHSTRHDAGGPGLKLTLRSGSRRSVALLDSSDSASLGLMLTLTFPVSGGAAVWNTIKFGDHNGVLMEVRMDSRQDAEHHHDGVTFDVSGGPVVFLKTRDAVALRGFVLEFFPPVEAGGGAV